MEKVDTFSYVPIISCLKTMLLNSSIFEEVRSYLCIYAVDYMNQIQITKDNKHNDNLIEDFCDDKKYEGNLFFSCAQDLTLQIILYFDELEICNPLGSARKKHKLGMLRKY